MVRHGITMLRYAAIDICIKDDIRVSHAVVECFRHASAVDKVHRGFITGTSHCPSNHTINSSVRSLLTRAESMRMFQSSSTAPLQAVGDLQIFR